MHEVSAGWFQVRDQSSLGQPIITLNLNPPANQNQSNSKTVSAMHPVYSSCRSLQQAPYHYLPMKIHETKCKRVTTLLRRYGNSVARYFVNLGRIKQTQRPRAKVHDSLVTTARSIKLYVI